MSELGTFGTSLYGFNRQDVANYIAYLNNKHASELQQLNNQLQEARKNRQENEELKHRLAQAEARCAALEQQLEEVQNVQPDEEAKRNELEAYRRAERVERESKERAERLCQQANAILADVALKVEDTVKQIDAATEQTAAQLKNCRESVLETQNAFHEISHTLYAIQAQDGTEQ